MSFWMQFEKWERGFIYWKYSNVHLRFPGLIRRETGGASDSKNPDPFYEPTLPYFENLPAVTHILIFQIA